VAGLQRDQIVILNLTTSPVSVTDWATTRYQQQCAKVFDTYMRDVDISPDGSYFVVGTTGAYRAGSLCDAAARWELGAGGSGQHRRVRRRPPALDEQQLRRQPGGPGAVAREAPESGVIGADTLVASGTGDGRNLSAISGMTMASGRLVYATTGTLATVDFSGGLPTGSATVLSGPIVDGQSWQSRGLFVL
jgi:hypothetical protein